MSKQQKRGLFGWLSKLMRQRFEAGLTGVAQESAQREKRILRKRSRRLSARARAENRRIAMILRILARQCERIKSSIKQA